MLGREGGERTDPPLSGLVCQVAVREHREHTEAQQEDDRIQVHGRGVGQGAGVAVEPVGSCEYRP